MLCHSLGKRGGYQGHNSHRLLRHGALLDAACADVVQKQHAHLVAGYQLVGTVRALHGNAHPVSIRVSGKHQVSITFLCQLQAGLQGCINLRIWVAAGGKVAVRVFLLRHNGNIGDADVLQHLGNRDQAGAVQRAVYQLQAAGLGKARTHLAGFDCLVECLFAVIPYEADEAVLYALGKGNHFCTVQHINFLNFLIYNISSLVRHLAAVRAVCLVAVVLGRVVGGSHHDTGVAVVVPGGKGKGRYRHGSIIDAYLDAVGSQHPCGSLGEDVALETGVVADCHGLGAALGLYPVGKALGSLGYHIDVHAVGTGSQHATEAGRTEFQGNREAVLDFLVVALNAPQLRAQVSISQVGCQPAFVFFVVHHITPYLCKY